MKRKTVFVLLLLCALVAAVLFFPFKKTYSISGNGAVLTLGKEKIGDCTMSVEIQELRSLVVSYRKTFSYVLDGSDSAPNFFHTRPEYYDHSTGTPCLLTQGYYLDNGEIEFNSLLYASDFSYAVLEMSNALYYIDNGANMAYSDIPYNHVSS